MSTGLRQLEYDGRVRAVLRTTDRASSIVSVVEKSLSLTLAGVDGDAHTGLEAIAGPRYSGVYDHDESIRNGRQLSVVSMEELDEIADALRLPTLPPEWLGANIETVGIPALTLLPPSSRLVFSGGAVLVVNLENRPCALPGKIIEAHHKGVGRKFLSEAKRRRGVTAWVERAGFIRIDDALQVYVPDQPAYPFA